MRRRRIMHILFHWYFLIRRPMTLGVRVLASNRKGEILLVRHTYVDGWHLPGGGVERTQTAIEAAVRELEEETGFRPVGELQLRGIFLNRHASPRDHVMLFTCDDVIEVSPFVATKEIAEIGFYSPSQLPQNTSRGTSARIAEWLNGSELPQHW